MKFNKIFTILFSILLFSGCSSENISGKKIYDENNVSIYLQEDKEQKLYRNNNEKIEIACYTEWDIDTNAGDGNLFKIKKDTDRGSVSLTLRKDALGEAKDINSLAAIYEKQLKDGIVRSTGVTIGGKKGKWLKVESIEGSGVGLKNKDTGESVDIDESNLVKNDNAQDREDIIFITTDEFAYVFTFHADNVDLYNSYENAIDVFLATFRFIE